MIYQKGELIFKGTTNNLYLATDKDGDVLAYDIIIERTDKLVTPNGNRSRVVAGKGESVNRISNYLFRLLEREGIPTHYVEEIGACETVIRKLERLPIEIVVRNIAAGDICRRMPFKNGTVLRAPIIELYCNGPKGDIMINDDHACESGLVSNELELVEEKKLAESVNRVLRDYLRNIGITLVDFQLELGRREDGTIVVIGDISPDTCRLWDSKTRRSLDKRTFYRGALDEKIIAAYREVLNRLEAVQ